MKMSFRRIITLCSLVLAISLQAWADSDIYGKLNTGSQRLSLEGGIGFATQVNGFSDSEQAGPMGGLQYLYGLSRHWSMGLQADYFHFPAQDHVISSTYGGQLDAGSTDNVGTMEIMARYSFLTDARFVPYLDSGVGANYFHQSTQATPVNGSSWVDTGTTETRELQNAATVNFSCSAGLGVETFLTNQLVLGLEAAWHLFGVSESLFGTSDINVPTVSIRLGWRFGAATETEP